MVLAGGGFVCLSTYLLCVSLLYVAGSQAEAVTLAKVLGGWTQFAPVLFMHAVILLTGWRSATRRFVLWSMYAWAGAMFVMGFSDTLFYDYWSPAVPENFAGYPVGVLYPLAMLQVAVPLVIATLLLVRARQRLAAGDRRLRRQLDLLLAGTALMLLAALVLFANALAGGTLEESLVQPVLLLGAAITAVSLTRYRGHVEGQLLRSDFGESFLEVAGLVTAFVILLALADGTIELAAGVGWFFVALLTFRDEVRALADRVFYGAGSRAGRAGLRTAASYAGIPESLDMAALQPDGYTGVLDLLGELDRAEVASAKLAGQQDPRLDLLARDEFQPVRAALGLPAEWSPAIGLAFDAVRTHVDGALKPRERQSLGLKFLGYSDKQAAQLMGVKPNVPRSYLGDAKRKLGLAAGAQLMLFVHFSGVVDTDALPMLEPGGPGSQTAMDAAPFKESRH